MSAERLLAALAARAPDAVVLRGETDSWRAADVLDMAGANSFAVTGRHQVQRQRLDGERQPCRVAQAVLAQHFVEHGGFDAFEAQAAFEVAGQRTRAARMRYLAGHTLGAEVGQQVQPQRKGDPDGVPGGLRWSCGTADLRRSDQG